MGGISAPRSPMAPVNPYSGGAPANTVDSYTGSLEPPQRSAFPPPAGGGGQQSYFSGGKPRRKAPPGYGTTPPPRNRPGNRKTGRPQRIGGPTQAPPMESPLPVNPLSTETEPFGQDWATPRRLGRGGY